MDTSEHVPMFLAECREHSGGAVLSDGGIALIIDCDALAASSARAAHPTPLTV